MVIYINASGCANACRHCSVSGRPPCGGFYSLDDLRRIAREWGSVVPYFEFTAHPEFPETMDPEIVGDGWTCPPTTGLGLVEREDYKAVFSRLREFGWKGLSFTLHGLEGRHDWFAGRKGAFQTIIEASRRAAEAGFEVFWQAYLDCRILKDIPELLELRTREFGFKPLWLEIPYHRVSRRSWRYEKLRPQLADVRELLEGLDPETWNGWLKDRPLEELTQSAWLSAWRQEPDSDEFGPPPDFWPPKVPFDKVWILVSKNGQVSHDPWCGEPIRLGKLADGKDEIVRRLQRVAAPPFSDMTPVEAIAMLPESDSELLHPNGFSVRCKAISRAIFGSGEQIEA